MAIYIHHGMGYYVEYDDETDVLLARYEKTPDPEVWLPVARDPDLEIGAIPRVERVCVDRWYDEYEDQIIHRQVSLRLKNAKAHKDYSLDEVTLMTWDHTVSLGILNVLRHGMMALAGTHWRPFKLKET